LQNRPPAEQSFCRPVEIRQYLKRIRISTLMLLVAIVALVAALIVQGQRAAKLAAMLKAEAAKSRADAVVLEKFHQAMLQQQRLPPQVDKQETDRLKAEAAARQPPAPAKP
jgi:parvulin-like peptidyl-prolyl isomerase